MSNVLKSLSSDSMMPLSMLPGRFRLWCWTGCKRTDSPKRSRCQRVRSLRPEPAYIRPQSQRGQEYSGIPSRPHSDSPAKPRTIHRKRVWQFVLAVIKARMLDAVEDLLPACMLENGRRYCNRGHNEHGGQPRLAVQ
jgi:hypothetical protein